MADTPATQPGAKFPSSIPYIIGNEAAERFNYYGLRAILTTFMIAQFYNPMGSTDPETVQKAEAIANAKTHDFVAMVYLLPMFGGMIADWFWGKYKTIFRLSLVYAIGSVLVALSVNNEMMFTTALMIIAIGAGGILSISVLSFLSCLFLTSNQLMARPWRSACPLSPCW
ncbi:MAG: hypothetical protein LW693_05090 [Saprospiraceae bacterium]|nr:hypothetical protein [Saprospiraceae bacterium]